MVGKIERRDMEILIRTVGDKASPAAQLDAAKALEAHLANREQTLIDDDLAEAASVAVKRYRAR
jgi:hypothetical protein